MKILVYGVGAIGSLMTHYLIKAGCDVTVVARSTYDTLSTKGIEIYHCLQKKTTTDHPKVIQEVDLTEHYDIVFSILQGQQQNALVKTFAALNSKYIVLVGNNMEAEQQEAYILKHTRVPKKVLFGFQNSAGHRENGKIVCGRLPVTELFIGGLHRSASDKERDLLAKAFQAKGYKLTFCDDMYSYFFCHVAEIMPYCFLAYKVDCDLKKATSKDIRKVMQASHEAFQYLKSIGVKMVPTGEDAFYDAGIKGKAMSLVYNIMRKTVLGKIMVADHCRNGVEEMVYIEAHLNALRKEKPGTSMPTWDVLRSQLPAWNEVGADSSWRDNKRQLN